MVVASILSASEKTAPSHSFGTHGCVIGCHWDNMHNLINQAHRCAQQGCMDTHRAVSQYALLSLLLFHSCNVTHKYLGDCVP